jgi:hypothetical protein
LPRGETGVTVAPSIKPRVNTVRRGQPNDLGYRVEDSMKYLVRHGRVDGDGNAFHVAQKYRFLGRATGEFHSVVPWIIAVSFGNGL